MMKIAIAYNINGVKLAETVKSCLSELGHEIFDFGNTKEGVDDTDIVYTACEQLSSKQIDRTILLCGAGQCTCIVANKMDGLYAAACNDEFEARLARQRYNTNVLCLPVRWLDITRAAMIVKEWLNTPFQDTPRNKRAMKKIRAIEEGLSPAEVTPPEIDSSDPS